MVSTEPFITQDEITAPLITLRALILFLTPPGGLFKVESYQKICPDKKMC